MTEEGYLKNCASNRQQYLAAEANAKRRKLGFWDQPNPLMPWDFRRGKTASHSQSDSITQSSRTNCDPSYPDICLTSGAADLDCKDIPYRNFRVVGSNPHRFDRNGDGIGCER
ncbi:excalibur calcium-binding domain-containing protein [Merismopedia glauca]|uniref:excalibur calcium-binding domain-containing protein n=1 Tax=Merismopedia glauca TaxID=292586 RepID=UPI001C62538D|nr:excalibur calcium-binding domain-containing protein [Merismopedia glauca]